MITTALIKLFTNGGKKEVNYKNYIPLHSNFQIFKHNIKNSKKVTFPKIEDCGCKIDFVEIHFENGTILRGFLTNEIIVSKGMSPQFAKGSIIIED